ncbi:MAG: peptidase domain-containing ABC transporter [Gammaproteobacteria bacterium]|nr:peptidase domain-containing ABC transporter [Gammaproteobacteria bacterium]
MLKRNKLPFIFQSEMAECGLACIAMILSYYGGMNSLFTLRKIYKPSLVGMTLYHLKKIAEDLGLIVSVLRIDIYQLSSISLPSIIHWDMNHFMVIREVSANFITVHDPARGVRKISLDDVSKSFTGIVLEIKHASSFKPLLAVPNQSNNMMMELFKKYGLSLAKLVLISGFIQLFYIGGVSFIQKSIDSSTHLFQNRTLYILLFAFLGAKVMEFSTTAIRGFTVTYLGTLINHEFGASVMKHLISLPISFFETRHVGDVLSRFGAVDKIRTTLTEGFVEGIVDGFVSIIILIVMCLSNFKMSLIVILSCVLYFISKMYYNIKIRTYQEEALYTRSAELTHFMETVRAIPSIKIFAKENDRLNGWSNRLIRYLNATTKIASHKILYDSVKNLIYAIDLTLVLAVGCLFLAYHAITLGVLYAFLAYRQQLITSFGSLIDKIQEFRFLKLYLDRLNDIVSEPLELNPSLSHFSPSLTAQKNILTLKKISHTFPMSDKALFDNLSLSIHPGECIAITGPSGCGKTTLLKIMMGLLQPSSGHFYVGNIQIYPHHVAQYRSCIAAVLQEDILFSGTISDNISYFDPAVSEDHVYHCAKLAGIYDEIHVFPMRFNTLIGDMGSVLSGGQKQRLLLARALYSNPSILFLDEASSHLDAKKEQEINLAIRSLGITVVMIAHRKETIMIADRVITLNGVPAGPSEAQVSYDASKLIYHT